MIINVIYFQKYNLKYEFACSSNFELNEEELQSSSEMEYNFFNIEEVIWEREY